MNYFAHGYRFLDNPYFLAGTAVPDWLSVVNRRVRAHRARAERFAADADEQIAALACGIMQHHDDDGWFHNTDAFNRLAWQMAHLCSQALPPEEGYRPSFLGHILLELLLDDALIAADPPHLTRYYAALEHVDPSQIERIVTTISGRPADGLAWFIDKFREVRFLADYADDERLRYRLNQVMRRANQSPLPPSFCSMLSEARAIIAAEAHQLLAPATLAPRRKVG
jgi:hypothetical protein